MEQQKNSLCEDIQDQEGIQKILTIVCILKSDFQEKCSCKLSLKPLQPVHVVLHEVEHVVVLPASLKKSEHRRVANSCAPCTWRTRCRTVIMQYELSYCDDACSRCTHSYIHTYIHTCSTCTVGEGGTFSEARVTRADVLVTRAVQY